MTTYKGINHIALATGDMDSTVRFWRDLLGMRLVAGLGRSGDRQYFLEITEGVMVSFFEWPGVKPAEDRDPGRAVEGPFVFDHICFELEGEKELWALKDRLEAADVWVTEVIDNGFILSMFSTDPNNIQLEFCCKVKGVNISKNPRMVDASPSAVTLEGPEPRSEKWPEATYPTPEKEKRVYPGELGKLFKGKNKW